MTREKRSPICRFQRYPDGVIGKTVPSPPAAQTKKLSTVKEETLNTALITMHWNILLTDLNLSNGNKLWDTLKSEIFPKRHAVVHKADNVEEKYPLCAVECTRVLLKEVVVPMAKKFGLTWSETQSGIKLIIELEQV